LSGANLQIFVLLLIFSKTKKMKNYFSFLFSQDFHKENFVVVGTFQIKDISLAVKKHRIFEHLGVRPTNVMKT